MQKVNKIRLNDYGFYSATAIPSQEELKEYYSNTYYQEAKGAYQKTYSEQEIELIRNKLSEKYLIASRHIANITSFLDIGCGEGWALKYFKEKGAEVMGMDFSQYGCSRFNPDCVDKVMIGDIYENIEIYLRKGKRFDVLMMSNLLEHVIDPKDLLVKCQSLISDAGILIVTVPNDFSILQKYLLDEGYVDRAYWVALPDHLSYFNKEGLQNIADAANWKLVDMIADFPIDLALLNQNTNYVNDREKGRSVHLQRVAVENLFYATSLELTVDYYRALAKLGYGRGIVAFFNKSFANGNI